MDIRLSGALTTVQNMVNGLIALLPDLLVALLFFALSVILGRAIRTVVRRITLQHKQHISLGLLMGRLAQGLIIFVGALIAFAIAIPSFKPSQVIQLLGISGVAIGFAFKDIFQNFLAGMLLLLTEPFRIGDQIVVGAFEGTVEDIQTRATMIRTYDGRRVVIPNAELFTGSVVVNTAFDYRRTEYEVGIGYGENIDAVKALIMQAIKAVPGVVEDPAPDILTVALASSTINLRARWWSQPHRGEVLKVQDQVISGIFNLLNSKGIDMPYPTQTVLLQSQTAPSGPPAEGAGAEPSEKPAEDQVTLSS